MKLPISLIILTYNEEKNIGECLESVKDLFEEIFIVDSYSTDKTLEIAGKYTNKIYKNPFKNYSAQRNWAFEKLPLKKDWIFNMDADHRMTPELGKELVSIFSAPVSENISGYMASRKTIFMGKWIRHGGCISAVSAFIIS